MGDFHFFQVIGIYDNSILVIFPSWRELSRAKNVRFSLSFHGFMSKSCGFTMVFDTDMPRVAFFVPKTKTNFFFQDRCKGAYWEKERFEREWRHFHAPSRGHPVHFKQKLDFSMSFHTFMIKSWCFTVCFWHWHAARSVFFLCLKRKPSSTSKMGDFYCYPS